MSFISAADTLTIWPGNQEDLFLNETARDRESIKALIVKLQAVTKLQRDVIVPATNLRLVAQDDGVPQFQILLEDGERHSFTLRGTAHDQIGAECGIPSRYYDRCLTSAPSLLTQNANQWLPKTGKTYLVRTVGDYVTALLSNSYKGIQNPDVFTQAFLAGREIGAEPNRAQLGERQFHLSLVAPDWAENVSTVGGFTKPVDMGLMLPLWQISNSETGHGGLNIDIGVFKMVCQNNNVWSQSLRRIHRGARQDDFGFVSDETRRLASALDISLVKDTIKSAFTRETFHTMLKSIREGTGKVIDKPVEAVKVLGATYQFTEAEQSDILEEFMSPTLNAYHGPSVTAMADAITFVAQKYTPDRGAELSRVAGKLYDDADSLRVGGKPLVRAG